MNLPKALLPREKAIRDGINTLSDEEVMAIILRTGYPGCNVLEVAYNLIERFNGLQNLDDIEINQLKDIKGIGPSKAMEIMACIELHKRIIGAKLKKYVYLTNPDKIFSLYQAKFIDEKQEKFVVITLNSKNAVISENTLFIGTCNKSLVHPRDIIKLLGQDNATSFICLHNHPSGDVNPSPDDIEVTNKLVEIGSLIGIPMLDHLIIGHDSYFSFKQNSI